MGYQFVVDLEMPHAGGNIAEGDPCTFAPTVWRYAIDRFAVSSVLDLGSGRGHAANYFFRRGIAVVAVDGLAWNVDQALYPTVFADLTDRPVNCNVDLVHCQEVVEHIEEKYLANLLISLACGKFIIMSHAGPGQAGHHHVNLQEAPYWIERVGSMGYTLLPEDTDRVRAFAAKDGAAHLARSGLVFARQ